MNGLKITILPYKNCLRSKKVLEFLNKHQIPYEQVSPESQSGKRLYNQYQFRASPGIIVEGKSINPYDILIWKECRINEEKALGLFTGLPSP